MTARVDHELLVLRLWRRRPRDLAVAVHDLARRGKRPDRATQSRLRELLVHRDARVREAAAEACAKLRVRAAVPDLVALLCDPTQPAAVRDTSAFALDMIGDPRAFAPLACVSLQTQDAPDLRTLHERATEAAVAMSRELGLS